jgi:hypothetical protein
LRARTPCRARCTRYKIVWQVYLRLATGRYFSPSISASLTNKTDSHNRAEILLKVTLNTIIKPFYYRHIRMCFLCSNCVIYQYAFKMIKNSHFATKNIFKTDTLEIKLSRGWNTNNKQQWTDSAFNECHLRMCEGWRGDPDIQIKPTKINK